MAKDESETCSIQIEGQWSLEDLYVLPRALPINFAALLAAGGSDLNIPKSEFKITNEH